ncbi:MAG TPA: hypothetical protein VKP30_18155, partial [Polyangiaceae bacterium]|nr:hypothetical protein [Polyangiaceae bacterium]
PEDHPSEDPIFPLVSAPIPQAVDIQPSIEIGPSDTGQAAPGAATPGELAPPQIRDTLRSPSDQESQPRSVRNLEAAPDLAPQPDVDVTAPNRPNESNSPNESNRPNEPVATGATSTRMATTTAAESDKTLYSPSESAAPPRSIPSRSARPSPIPPDRQRQVGWMQAVGLATLAGIVTFAVTVPIASWFHRRQEPLRTEPPVAAEASPTASTPPVADQSSVPASAISGGTAPNASESSNSPPAPSASIEEIAVPSNVTLRPGEAVIEVMTGGDHAIFLDDTFVGRGPVRVIPVANGRHVVRTRLNGAERSDSVEVGTGRALRLSLEQAWK